MKPRDLLILTGPTASGKSSLALEVCERIGGEIVSCDSMQIYRGCDIATAKPTAAERYRVPHHLLDICEPDERFSAAQWAGAARNAIGAIESRGKIPVVCGGTGFYLRALLQPEVLAEVEPDVTLRAELNAELEQTGTAAMHEKLAGLDPGAGARLHPNDTFRVIRALEVALSPVKAKEKLVENEFVPRIFGIDWPRKVLYERIDQRVDLMVAMGIMDELRRLVDVWGTDASALGGVGYRQMMPALSDPACFDESLEIWKRDTRRYAKRQMTWFRHQLDVKWMEGDVSLESMSSAIAI